MQGEQRVASLLCSEVLADLSDYLDGGLAPAARADIEAHVRGCDACARFGGRFAETVARLRRSLLDEPVPDDVLARVRARLGRA
jgi:anti-sigma factor RsiW